MHQELNKLNLNESVLKEIKERKLLIRPRWRFVMEKIGMESGIIVLVLLAGGFLSLSYLYGKSNELGHLFEFGPDGLFLIFIHFPFELLIIALMFVYGINYLGRKLELSYKMRGLYWYSLIALFLIFIVVVAEVFGLHKALDDYETSADRSIMTPYFVNRLHNVHNNTIDAKVEMIVGDQVKASFVINHEATSTFLKYSQLKRGRSTSTLHPGDHIQIIGEWHQHSFSPWGIYKK